MNDATGGSIRMGTGDRPVYAPFKLDLPRYGLRIPREPVYDEIVAAEQRLDGVVLQRWEAVDGYVTVPGDVEKIPGSEIVAIARKGTDLLEPYRITYGR